MDVFSASQKLFTFFSYLLNRRKRKRASVIAIEKMKKRTNWKNPRNVFSFCAFLTCASYCSFSMASPRAPAISPSEEFQQEVKYLQCQFDQFLCGNTYTCVLVWGLKRHSPIRHLHVESSDRLTYVGCKPLLFLLALNQVLETIIWLWGKLEQHGYFLGNLRIRLIAIGSLQNLILCLDT